MHFFLPHDFLNSIFLSQAYYSIRIQNIIHITYKIRTSQLSVLSVRIPVNSRLLMLSYWGIKIICGFSTVRAFDNPNPHAVQGSTIN